VIQGQGPERGRIDEALRSLGIADRVRFSPWIPTFEMPDVYRSADIVVMPSLPTPYSNEQFGYNLAEAMACGRPVVTTAGSSAVHTLGDGGLVVPPYDQVALADAISRLVESPELRVALAARGVRHVVSNYSVDVVGAAFVAACRAARARPRART
jgi:alpha-maltose-1-phosphate synthase